MTARECVYIVDDEQGVLSALSGLVESIGLNPSVYSDSGKFLSEYEPDNACCVILDVRMKGADGLNILSRLKSMSYPVPVIVISGYADVPMTVKAMKLGAFDFFEKPFREQDMLDSINRAVNIWKDKDFNYRRLREFKEKLSTLTRREQQVLDHLISGKSNKEVAYELGLSRKTVDFHRRNILSKMEAKSVVDLTRQRLEILLMEDFSR